MSNFGRLFQAVLLRAVLKDLQEDVDEAPHLIKFPHHTVSGIPTSKPIKYCSGGPVCHTHTMNHSVELCFCIRSPM